MDHRPYLLDDGHAVRLVESIDPTPLRYQELHPAEPVLAAARLSATARSRFAEDRLTASACRQYVVLGAGLDTFAVRIAAPLGCRTYHVDLPGTLAWRSEAFARAGVDPVGAAVPVDLGSEPLVPALAAAGLRVDLPVFVSWLGVTMYLPVEAVRHVLRQLCALAIGSELVADVVLPPGDRDDAGAGYARAVSATTGGSGEPWLTTVDGAGLTGWFADLGWTSVTCVDEADGLPPGAWARTDALRPQRLIAFAHARR